MVRGSHLPVPHLPALFLCWLQPVCLAGLGTVPVQSGEFGAGDFGTGFSGHKYAQAQHTLSL